MANHTFIADVHLGKLARLLRLLGFDTLYSNAATPAQLMDVAKAQNRILLSRYTVFAKYLSVPSFILLSEDPQKQLQQMVQHFHLNEVLHPFSRCLLCNGVLTTVAKEIIQDQLEPNTRRDFNVFWQCSGCGHLYWKSSHYDRMLALVAQVKQFTHE